ncbi:MAG: DMT family transporter [Phyllobacteriaceae bacterium]|nr:DMT family transporter [Phyllobacteriaceae bacterium]
MNATANGRAALLMMLAMTAFTLNDAITKWVATDIGVGQTMLLRGLIATSLLATLAYMQGAFDKPRLLLGRAVTLRSVLEVGGTVTFLLGLPHLPISNVSAIYQALPLVVTLGAALFLAEPVGWRRWLAILVGFLGVMLIVRPGMQGFSFWSVIIVVSLFFSAARDLVTRRMPHDLSTFWRCHAGCAGRHDFRWRDDPVSRRAAAGQHGAGRRHCRGSAIADDRLPHPDFGHAHGRNLVRGTIPLCRADCGADSRLFRV